MARHGIRPNRELGQHFLVDDNILDVIGRAAELSGSDVVLEIGGGLGILSVHLARQVAHVHVVETDARLEPVLAEALKAHPDASLLIDDIMEVELATLRPRPGKVVANLPYGVAVPAIVKTTEELEEASLWCVMVQREIADRLAARPGTKAYGVPSVVVQLCCAVELLRPISRTVFQPVPNVDSALIRLRRLNPSPPPWVLSLVRGCFAHRRKALARSLELTRATKDVRPAARSALVEMGHPADERAERLAPEEFTELAERLRQWL